MTIPRYFFKIFLFYFPFFLATNLLLADEINGLVEENFGERFYGVYLDEFKLGYLIHKISQTDDTITQDFSMNMRVTLSEQEQEEYKAKYVFSQIISRYEFDKETGLLNEMTEAEGKKYYADYDSLLNGSHLKQNISTLTAKYKGNLSYEVLMSNKNGVTSKSLKLPSLHMYDYFAEINFALSSPEIGETRAIEVFDLDFENEVFMSATLTLKQKERVSGGLGAKYKNRYVIQEQLDGENFTYTVDQYGNIVKAEMLGLNIIREPKERALTLDAKNI